MPAETAREMVPHASRTDGVGRPFDGRSATPPNCTRPSPTASGRGDLSHGTGPVFHADPSAADPTHPTCLASNGGARRHRPAPRVWLDGELRGRGHRGGRGGDAAQEYGFRAFGGQDVEGDDH